MVVHIWKAKSPVAKTETSLIIEDRATNSIHEPSEFMLLADVEERMIEGSVLKPSLDLKPSYPLEVVAIPYLIGYVVLKY